MVIRFKCPKCGKVLSVKDENAWKKGRCPKCKEMFVVPKAENSEAQPTRGVVLTQDPNTHQENKQPGQPSAKVSVSSSVRSSKKWKYGIGVLSVLIVIGLWRGCSERASEKKWITEMEQQWDETTAEINRKKKDDIAARTAEAKVMEYIKAADTKRSIAERTEAAKATAKIEATRQADLALAKIKEKCDAWNQGLSSEVREYDEEVNNFFSGLQAQIDSKLGMKPSYNLARFNKIFGHPDSYAAAAGKSLYYKCKDGYICLTKGEQAFSIVEHKYKYYKYAFWYKYNSWNMEQLFVITFKPLTNSYYIKNTLKPLPSEAGKARFKLKNKSIAEVEDMIEDWNKGIEFELEQYLEAVAKAHDSLTIEFLSKLPETNYNIATFYNIFGKPFFREIHQFAGDGDNFYYKCPAGFIEISLKNGYNKLSYRCIGKLSARRVDNILATFCLADKRSVQRLRNKSIDEIKKMVFDWRFGNLQKTKTKDNGIDISVDTFYDAFGKPEHIRLHVEDVYNDNCYFDYKYKDGMVSLEINLGNLEWDKVNISRVSIRQPGKQLLKGKTIDEVKSIAKDWNGLGTKGLSVEKIERSRTLAALIAFLGEPDSHNNCYSKRGFNVDDMGGYLVYRCKDGMVELRVRKISPRTVMIQNVDLYLPFN